MCIVQINNRNSSSRGKHSYFEFQSSEIEQKYVLNCTLCCFDCNFSPYDVAVEAVEAVVAVVAVETVVPPDEVWVWPLGDDVVTDDPGCVFPEFFGN